MELRFDGRVAVITGGGRGMGRTHALELAARGAAVVVNDIGATLEGDGLDPEPANSVAEEIRSAGGEAVANTDTVATTGGAEAMIGSAIEHFGRVDIVVNNAGVATAGSLTEIDLDDFNKHISVHLAGAFNVSRAAWPQMVRQRHGRIVMITSSAILGIANFISYSAAKAGQIGLTKSLALAGAEHDVKVNAIAPAAYTRMRGNVTTLPNGETRPVAAENVSAAVAALSHPSCPVTGEIFGVGAGNIGRLFIADTRGYIIAEDLTPEGVQEHWPQILDESGYYVPDHCSAHSDRLRDPHHLLRGLDPRVGSL